MFLVFLLRCFGDLGLPYTHENEGLFGKSTAFLKKNRHSAPSGGQTAGKTTAHPLSDYRSPRLSYCTPDFTYYSPYSQLPFLSIYFYIKMNFLNQFKGFQVQAGRTRSPVPPLHTIRTHTRTHAGEAEWKANRNRC